MNFWETPFYGNTPARWLTAAGVLLATLVIFRLVASVVVRRLEAFSRRTDTRLDDLASLLLDRTGAPFLFVVAVWAASYSVKLPVRLEGGIRVAAVLALLAQAGVWGGAAITFFIRGYRNRQLEVDAEAVTTVSAFGFIGKLILWSTLLILALDNLGFEVKTLLAGLGVGGIAVALAVQNILGDLFASLSIVLDKPFVIGDFLVVGDHMGTVEQVGIKTTRIRSLSGEQLVFSNADLLESRIRNYGRMRERRAVFEFGVTYDTPPDVAERIPDMVRDILRGHDEVRVDRSHFKAFGDSALEFETVYFVSDPAFNTYMDIQQAVNLDLMRRFEDERIEFAFPTRTVRLDGRAPRGEPRTIGPTPEPSRV
jgi:small-conductance mechanosensitive channel